MIIEINRLTAEILKRLVAEELNREREKAALNAGPYGMSEDRNTAQFTIASTYGLQTLLDDLKKGIEQNSIKLKSGKKVMVNIETDITKGEKWVQATYIKKGYCSTCLVDIDGVLHSYSKRLLKDIE